MSVAQRVPLFALSEMPVVQPDGSSDEDGDDVPDKVLDRVRISRRDGNGGVRWYGDCHWTQRHEERPIDIGGDVDEVEHNDEQPNLSLIHISEPTRPY